MSDDEKSIDELFDASREARMTDETAARIRSRLEALPSLFIAGLIEIAEAAHVTAKEREIKHVMQRVQQMLDEHGLDIDEVMQKTAESAAAHRTGEPVRFRHPENPRLTWTGRGRRPSWIKKAEDAGEDLEKFRI